MENPPLHIPPHPDPAVGLCPKKKSQMQNFGTERARSGVCRANPALGPGGGGGAFKGFRSWQIRWIFFPLACAAQISLPDGISGRPTLPLGSLRLGLESFEILGHWVISTG